MKAWIVTALVAVGGNAFAQQDPLEMTANAQVTAQAPGAQMVAPFFKGAAPKTDYQVVLEAGKCYWFSGAAGGAVKKLALYLWGPDGKRLTDAKSGGPLTTMAFCPNVSGMHKFQAKIEGNGFYAVGLYAKDAPRQAAAPPPPPPPPSQPKVDLGAIIERQASAAAPGAHRVGEFLDGAAGRMEHGEWSTMLDAGKCYWFIGAGSPGDVKALSLFLWGPNNKRITESKSSNPNAMVGHCATVPGMYKVQAKVASGGGDYKVGIYAR